MGFFKSLKEGLKKTRDSIFGQIDALFKRFKKVDEELFEELEELLIAADVGMLTSEKICDTLRDKVKSTGTKDPQEVRDLFVETISEMLEGDMSLKLDTSSPMSPGTSSASTRTEKSPCETACMASTRSFIGFSLLRPMPAASVSMNTISSIGMASVRNSGFTSSPKNTRKP